MTVEANRRAALASFDVIATGDAVLACRVIAPDFVNQEAEDDPNQPNRRLNGPEGFLATANGLRSAFDHLRFDVLDTAAEGDKVVVTATMRGRHTGPFQNMAATGREFRQSQIHIFTCRDGMVVDHLAQRDGLGLLLSLGWRPDRAWRGVDARARRAKLNRR